MTAEMVTETGSHHQAHPSLRHIADHYHSMAWGDFLKQIDRGTHDGVLVGSKYAKDFTRAVAFSNPAVQEILSHYPEREGKRILAKFRSCYDLAPPPETEVHPGEPASVEDWANIFIAPEELAPFGANWGRRSTMIHMLLQAATEVIHEEIFTR
jgi:hypothetical protein